MNRFGPTPASTASAGRRAFNPLAAGNTVHIDTVMDLQAAGADIRDLVEEEAELLCILHRPRSH